VRKFIEAETIRHPAATNYQGVIVVSLALESVKDLATLNNLFRDPYISRIGHDHRPLAPINHPHVKYLSAKLNGEQVGAFMVIESGFIELDLHAMLSKRALPHSREFGQLCLVWAFAHKHIHRVTAYIIDGMQSAKNYCMKLGFKNEGTRRDACMKNGQLVGVHILGMTRQDWRAA
jgi:hypothetical protein